MNVCFMGSMEFAVPILEGLHEKYNIRLVVTQPDRPYGRKQVLKPTPVKAAAMRLGLEIFQPENIKNQNEEILNLDLDFIIVAAYGQIIPENILQHARYQAINVHASLLPKYRGGSPMHRAIQNGDKETGVSIMFMAKKMDAGDILAQRKIKIEHDDTVGTIEPKLAALGKDLLLETMEKLAHGEIVSKPQNLDEVTYAWNIKRHEEKIDFTKNAVAVYNHVRAFNPWPLTYATITNQKLKLYRVDHAEENYSKTPGEIVEIDKEGVFIQTGNGVVILKEIQLAGKKKMDISSFMNGVGQKLLIVGNKFD